MPDLPSAATVGSPDARQSSDPVAPGGPEVDGSALRDRLAESERKCGLAEAELRRELDKKQEIKRAVLAEMSQLASELAQTKALLQQRDEELLSALLEAKVLKDDLSGERKRADDLARERASLEEKGKALRNLEAELQAGRTAVRELEEARGSAGREAQQARSDLAKAKEAAAAEIGEARKKLAAAEARVLALKSSGDELRALKARHEEQRDRTEKERTELLEKSRHLQADLEKRDQRIRDLQLLVKTLGERLNDLTSRYF